MYKLYDLQPAKNLLEFADDLSIALALKAIMCIIVRHRYQRSIIINNRELCDEMKSLDRYGYHLDVRLSDNRIIEALRSQGYTAEYSEHALTLTVGGWWEEDKNV